MADFKKILVIGGAGFIGSYLVNNLAAQSGLKLAVIYHEDLPKESQLPGVSYHQMDLTNAPDEFSTLVNSSDCVVSLATPNISLIENLVASIKLSGSKKIVYTSTMLVYPDSEKRHSETVGPQPETKYEKDKVAEEQVLMKFVGTSKTRVCIARLGNVYGDVKNRGLIGYIMLALKNSSVLTINGQSEHRPDYIFVQDVVNLLEFLIFYPQQSELEIFNICSGQDYTINEVIAVAEKIAGQKIKKVYSKPIKEKLSVIGNNRKILNVSGYQLKYDLVAGLQQAYHNYSAKG